MAGYTLLLPVQDLPYSADTVTVLLLSSSASAGSDHLRITCLIAVFFLTANAVLCLLGLPFFSFLFFLSVSLSVLISWRSPARSILFALGQDKHCLCVTPKTFHRLSRFQHGPDISIIGFFLLGVCERETERARESEEREKKEGEGKRASNWQERGARKGHFPFPPGPH